MPTYFKQAEAIAGERIASSFRRIHVRGAISKGVLGFRCFQAKLRTNVFCVIDKCLEAEVSVFLKRSNVHVKRGDSLKAEQIVAEFGGRRKLSIAHGSSTHQIQRTVFEHKVYCVIDLPFEPLRGK